MSTPEHTARYLAAADGRVVWQERAFGPLPPLHVRVRTLFSGLSVGTEIETVRRSKSGTLAADANLGYQLVGEVLESAIDGIVPGTRVACYGGPYVHHASIVEVPKHLCAQLPASVVVPDGGYCGLGAIALHAFRSTAAALGEITAVIGLGMVGNLIAQISRAAGCQVFGLEPVAERRSLAGECGIATAASTAELYDQVLSASNGAGADAVLIAAGNCSSDLLEFACSLVRRAGCIAIVGLCDAAVPRESLFQTEARILVPRAGGPGRRDPQYERLGIDYPYEHARWTEHRNLHEFLRLLEIGAVQISTLYDVVPVSDAPATYERLQSRMSAHLGHVFDWQGL
ncbi:MAG: zinc-dependent alcohol dehydrogenase [Candidatus Sumerlaeaceae bacterium]